MDKPIQQTQRCSRGSLTAVRGGQAYGVSNASYDKRFNRRLAGFAVGETQLE